MRKKVLAILAVLTLALSLSACGGTQVKLPSLAAETSSTSSGDAETVHKKPDSSNYQDTLIGLLTYMEDGKAVARDTEAVTFEENSAVAADGTTSFVQMAYQEIGAVNGYRYQFTFNKSAVQAEFYEFDPSNLNEDAQECISSVKEKGYFEFLGNDIRATLHPSGKYLMIYTDVNAEKNEESKAQKEWAQELFLSFQG